MRRSPTQTEVSSKVSQAVQVSTSTHHKWGVDQECDRQTDGQTDR